MSDVELKIERVRQLAETRGLAGILIVRQPNFAWLTDGQSNRIDGSVDVGAGSLLIGSSGARHLVANTIEMPRLRDEALRGHGFEAVEYEWPRDHVDPSAPLHAAQRVVRGAIGADVALPGAIDVGDDLIAVQTPLTDAEIERYRALGRDVASALEQLCRALRPGLSECAIAAEVNSVVTITGARPIVTLVAADERIAAFRHPLPTSRGWIRTLLIGLCAERHGLVVALSRMISTNAAALRPLTTATAAVFRALLAATTPGRTGAELFSTAACAYGNVGHPGQEALHHQGGAIGYRSRDWIAHPHSAQVVRDRQAFAWNPSITGSKVEDTALLVDGEIELVTSTGEWPDVLEL